MEYRNWKTWAYILMIVGSIQFIILTFIAMIFYEGGTYIDSSTTGYLFWHNYFSDLGRTVAHSGIANEISFILFTIALTLWGLSHVPFFTAFSSFFKNDDGLKKITIAGSILGILTGIFYVGIAFTPSDLLDPMHDLFVVMAFSSIFLCIILYSFAIFENENYPNFYAIILAISVMILSIYYLLLLLNPGDGTSEVLFIHVVGQKVMIYTLLTCSIVQGFGALKQEIS